uniref:Multiple epidermal growth factor-like domains 11 n=1 Tax=Magallana gigas TaxID=29159 RepID=K1PS52_MAGGI
MYENVALNKPAWQQYPFPDSPWGAERAVDGRYIDLSQFDNQCTISADKKQTAEWRVDLGKVLSIHHIFIQYRTNNLDWDTKNDFAGRFLGFSVYVSNTTNKENGKLCFQDTSYTKATIPNPTNITCITHGRYVIYTNNRTHPPYPDGYHQYAFNELCELEVYGCPTPAYYGENCSLLCPQDCQESYCNIVDGTCLGCNDGYRGPTCDKKCSDGTYGLECGNACGNCSDGDWCNHVNGGCPNGCDVGVFGDTCDKECPNHTYGLECKMICGDCKNKESCHHVNGSCLNGCDKGVHGEKCDIACSDSRYGFNCQEQCNTNCGVPYSCARVTGQCEGGCQVGLKGVICSTPCNNDTYGTDCSMKCGNCLYLHGEQCHHVTGQCPRGCADGFHGGLCDQVSGSSSSDSASTSQLSNALYACVTIIILSVTLNVFFIIRQLRNNMSVKQKNKENLDESSVARIKGTEQSDNFSKSVYDKSEDNAEYQELGEKAKESQYDKIDIKLEF